MWSFEAPNICKTALNTSGVFNHQKWFQLWYPHFWSFKTPAISNVDEPIAPLFEFAELPTFVEEPPHST
jgi:hypothetical protein